MRVTPRNDSAAPLTFVYSSSPGVSVHAGLLHDFLFPDCGCDACDESWEGCADGLEWTVQTIVAGGYSEHVVSDRRLGVGYRLAGLGGMRSGSGRGRTFRPNGWRPHERGLPSWRYRRRGRNVTVDGPHSSARRRPMSLITNWMKSCSRSVMITSSTGSAGASPGQVD